MAYIFGQQEEEIDDVLGFSREFLAQHRILGCDSNWARVQVAFPHHCTTFEWKIVKLNELHTRSTPNQRTHDNQRSCAEAEFVCSQQRSDHDIEPSTKLPIRLQDNSMNE